MKPWLRCSVLSFLSLFGSLASPAAAAEASSPILDWVSGGALTLEAGKVTRVQILNRSAAPVKVRLSLSWLEEGTGKAPSPPVDINPSEIPLEPGRADVVQLKPAEKTVQGTYTGILLAIASPAGAPGGSIRRDVTLAVPAEAPPGEKTPIRFLTSEMKLRRYLVLPWPVPPGETVLPLSPGSDPKAVPDVYLADEHGDVARLDFVPPSRQPAAGVKGLRPRLSDIDEVGTYTGTLEGEKPVSITLVSAHHPSLAILAMTLAILLALAIQRYTGVWRPSWSLEERLTRLGTAFDQVDKQFQASAQGSRSGYSIAADFSNRKANLLTKVGDLKKSALTALDESSPAYKEVVDGAATLEAAVKTWGGLAENLDLLNQAIRRIAWDNLREPPLDQMPSRPAIHDAKQKLLTGGSITVQDLETLSAEISAAPASLALWKNLHGRAQLTHQRIRALLSTLGDPGNDADRQEVKARFQAAKGQLMPIWDRLWTRSDLDLPAEKTALDTVEDQLWIEEDRLKAWTLDRNALETAQSLVALGAKRRSFELLRELSEQAAPPAKPLSDLELLRLVRLRSRAAEVAIAGLAFLIALYTGMAAYYFDKPFGTWRNYAEIAAWAVGAQALSELLLKALGRLWELRGPMLKATVRRA